MITHPVLGGFLPLRSSTSECQHSSKESSIAKACKLTRITVIRVVSQLAQMHSIECDRAAGKKTVFHLMPFSNWRQPVSEQKQKIAKQQSKVIPFKANDIGGRSTVLMLDDRSALRD